MKPFLEGNRGSSHSAVTNALEENELLTNYEIDQVSGSSGKLEWANFNDRVFSVLETMVSALDRKVLVVNDELRDLILMCKKTLSLVPDQSGVAFYWDGLGYALRTYRRAVQLGLKDTTLGNERSDIGDVQTPSRTRLPQFEFPIDLDDGVECCRKAVGLTQGSNEHYLNRLAFLACERKAMLARLLVIPGSLTPLAHPAPLVANLDCFQILIGICTIKKFEKCHTIGKY